MTRRVPWLRSAVVRPPVTPAAAVEPLRDETSGYRDLLRDARNELTAANTSLAAEQKCTQTCAHARVAAELRIQLAAMQERLDVLQAANERQESRGFATRCEVPPYVPEQRRTT